MILVRSSVKYSSIHGLGCFAEEDIREGQVVWKFDPLIDIEYRAQDVSSFPEAFQEFLRIYAYSVMKDGEKTLILCGDHARHMNHTTTPNLYESPEGMNIADRDIKAGEELTCDYTLFDLDVRKKLGTETY
jgi:SET domain-containing protein